MRFDLRRVPPETMTAHLVELLGKEAIPYEPEALAMIVRAGEGSVRDCQSLLDQAISHGAGNVTAETVKAMLGLGDRARTIDLFEALMTGDIAAALTLMRFLYDAGADPQTIVADLCDFTHLVTRIKVVPAAADDAALTPEERRRGAELAMKLPMRALTRTWQILFKGFDEVAQAGNAMQAAEMVLIRLAYAADLPAPDELIARLSNGAAPAALPPAAPPLRGNGGGPQAARQLAPEPMPRFAPEPVAPPRGSPQSYAELVQLAADKRDLIVKHALESSLRPIAFADGRLEVALVAGANPDIIQTLQARLKLWTGRNWLVTVKNDAPAAPTLREIAEQQQEQARAEAHQDPLVQAVLETFPGARVVNVRLRGEPPVPAAIDLEEDEE
jgi:DNA polymerase-3 subunit gamma/tau